MQIPTVNLNTPTQPVVDPRIQLGWADSEVGRDKPPACPSGSKSDAQDIGRPGGSSLPERMGDWAETFSHKKFWPLDPHPDDICVADIARGLAFQCRFGGHCQEFYSIAQHAVLCCDVAPPHLAPLMLMHDAAEAFIQDIIRPIKYQLPEYLALEERWNEVIDEKFKLGGLLVDPPTEAKEIDNRVLMTERRDIKGWSELDWNISAEPYPDPITAWSPSHAERVWLSRFNDWFY